MAYLKTVLFLVGLLLVIDCNAQSKNSFVVKIDSVEINIYDNYESNHAPINFNRLPEQTLFILNDKELNITKFSALELPFNSMESIEIIKDKDTMREMGYANYNAIMKITTKDDD